MRGKNLLCLLCSTDIESVPNSPSPKHPTRGTLGNNRLNIVDSTFFSPLYIFCPRALHANINPMECFFNFTWSLNTFNFSSTCCFVLHFTSTTTDHDCIRPEIATMVICRFKEIEGTDLFACLACRRFTTPPHTETLLFLQLYIYKRINKFLLKLAGKRCLFKVYIMLI